MSASHLSDYARTLIEALFHEQDQKLLRAFQDRMERMSRREQLARLCGVHDEVLLDHMIDLDMQPEAVAAIAVVPLVVVAWADRTIQAEEREAIIKAAAASGVSSQDGRYPVLEYWLSNRPGPELLQAWKLYIAAICKKLSAEEVEELKHDLLDRAHTVAEAAGGFLGLGNKISPQERAALATLEQAFM